MAAAAEALEKAEVAAARARAKEDALAATAEASRDSREERTDALANVKAYLPYLAKLMGISSAAGTRREASARGTRY